MKSEAAPRKKGPEAPAGPPADRVVPAGKAEVATPFPVVSATVSVLLLLLTGLPLPREILGGAQVWLLTCGAVGLAFYRLGAPGAVSWLRHSRRLRPFLSALSAYLVWVILSAMVSSHPAYSVPELLRVGGGALLALLVAYGSEADRPLLLLLPLIVSAWIALPALWDAGVSRGARLGGLFADEQLLAAVLATYLPFGIVAVIRIRNVRQRLFAQASLTLSLVMLVATQNRAAWVAAAVGIVTLALLELGLSGPRRHSQRRLRGRLTWVPAFAALAAVGLALCWPSLAGSTSQRAETLAAIPADESFQWRQHAWQVALRMLQARPWLGWGIGTYPLQQSLFNEESRTEAEILTRGPGLSESAHNTFLQLGAELGIPGLLLYAGVFGTFFWVGANGLRREHSGATPARPDLHSRSWLAACMAGVVTQAVSGVASPAWEFPACSTVLWVLLGTGLYLAGPHAAGGGREVQHAG